MAVWSMSAGASTLRRWPAARPAPATSQGACRVAEQLPFPPSSLLSAGPPSLQLRRIPRRHGLATGPSSNFINFTSTQQQTDQIQCAVFSKLRSMPYTCWVIRLSILPFYHGTCHLFRAIVACVLYLIQYAREFLKRYMWLMQNKYGCNMSSTKINILPI
jgi:hypothetical protein